MRTEKPLQVHAMTYTVLEVGACADVMAYGDRHY